MNNYCSIKEAWGIETFDAAVPSKKKKRRKRRRRKEREYEPEPRQPEPRQPEMPEPRQPEMPEPRVLLNLEDIDGGSGLQDLEGYNSSDYEQYVIEDDENHQDMAPMSNYSTEVYDSPSHDMGNMSQVHSPADNVNNGQMDNVIMRLYDILERVENNVLTSSKSTMYDLVLFLFLGVFILFVIDYMYKIGTKAQRMI